MKKCVATIFTNEGAARQVRDPPPVLVTNPIAGDMSALKRIWQLGGGCWWEEKDK